ncbi:DUF6477 family protein [Mesobacterium sp. TK19101]|uniref:DUF6477 family protein n=1 Tax=Mesobacterium hydrothermale TaxID=3111907 RepID=A0ABU6HES6_9RHOB|nr:DUF6477 family protein [Mesobacterium sp. TK19101]MEC3860969.1 DUF6477 family protein [Mesobacterium sp. TK19101]
MHDILGLVEQIKRPRLLIHAARIGLEDYRRDSSLRRLLGYGSPPRTGAVLIRLIEIEAELDSRRRDSEAGYCIARHVEVLSAIMAEARLLRRALI